MVDGWMGRARAAVGTEEPLSPTSQVCLQTEFRAVTVPVDTVVRFELGLALGLGLGLGLGSKITVPVDTEFHSLSGARYCRY